MNRVSDAGRAVAADGRSDASPFWRLPLHRRLWRRQDKQRLAAEIVVTRHRYDVSGELATKRDQLLSSAEAALLKGDVDSSWAFLQHLEREMVPTLDPEQLRARLTSAIAEARSKLPQWRGKAVEALAGRWQLPSGQKIGGTSGEGVEATVPLQQHKLKREQMMLQEVLFHLHTRHQNVYHKLAKLRWQMWIVGGVMVALLGLVLALNAADFFAGLGDVNIRYDLWLAVLSGTLGGVLSVAYTVARSSAEQQIPEASASFVVTLIRPLIGGALALPILFFVHSGVMAIDAADTTWWLLAFCFLGGFSERWFLGLVESIGGTTRSAPGSKA